MVQTETVFVQKEIISGKEYWLAQDFTLVPAFHCVRCRQPFTEHSEEAVNYQGFNFCFRRGSFSGLCPECISWYRKTDQSMKGPYCKVKQRFFEHGEYIVHMSLYTELWNDGWVKQSDIEYRVYKKEEKTDGGNSDDLR